MQHSKKISRCFLIEKKKAPKSKFKIIVFLCLFAGFLFLLAFNDTGKVSADGLLDTVKEGGLDRIGNDVYGTSEPTDIRIIIVNIIQVFLGLLALLFVILILLAGFKWMTASGDAKKAEEAKKQITQAIIGLVIILAAWGFTIWFITVIAQQTNTTVI